MDASFCIIGDENCINGDGVVETEVFSLSIVFKVNSERKIVYKIIGWTKVNKNWATLNENWAKIYKTE